METRSAQYSLVDVTPTASFMARSGSCTPSTLIYLHNCVCRNRALHLQPRISSPTSPQNMLPSRPIAAQPDWDLRKSIAVGYIFSHRPVFKSIDSSKITSIIVVFSHLVKSFPLFSSPSLLQTASSMTIVTGRALHWAITCTAGSGFLLYDSLPQPRLCWED